MIVDEILADALGIKPSSEGMLLVTMLTNPPEKLAGNSAEAVLYNIKWSMALPAITSKAKARLSFSVPGAVIPFNNTVL